MRAITRTLCLLDCYLLDQEGGHVMRQGQGIEGDAYQT
jgi:hypothetical protein